MKISLIIPAYNEATRLPVFLNSLAAYMKIHPQDVSEVLVIDDGSLDATVAVAESYVGKIPNLRVLRQEKNQGKGAAVRAGVMAAIGDYMFFMDADGATDASEIPKMLAALQGADVAVGNRWMAGAQTHRSSPLRHLAGWTYRNYMGVFGLYDVDTMCGFKGYRGQVARDLFSNLLEERWLFDTEVAYKAVRRGYTIKNFPIRWQSIEGSKLSTADLLKSALNIWPLIRRIKKSRVA